MEGRRLAFLDHVLLVLHLLLVLASSTRLRLIHIVLALHQLFISQHGCLSEVAPPINKGAGIHGLVILALVVKARVFLVGARILLLRWMKVVRVRVLPVSTASLLHLVSLVHYLRRCPYLSCLLF